MSTDTSRPFQPTGTVALNASITPASILLAGRGHSLVVTNAGPSLAFVRFGTDLSVGAGTSDMPVLPNQRVLLKVNALIRTAGVVLTSGTGRIYFTRGDGSTL